MRPPLKNLKILDLSRLFPGPYATQMLADMGAEVVKVEPPGEGDYMRFMGPMAGDVSAFFQNINRNKKSLCLDLKHPDGPATLKRLAARCDVVVESFRPGVMDRLGVGYGVLSEANPGLVYCTITGYGNSGPLSDAAGHDLNYLAISGLLAQMRDSTGTPVVPGFQIADVGGGALHAVIGILAALNGRSFDGKGRRVDISMADTLAPWLVYPWSGLQAGDSSADSGALTGRFPCYSVYGTLDGGFMAVAALEPKFWKAFCLAIGMEEWIDRQFCTDPERSELFGKLKALFLTRTRAEWSALLEKADCCATPVLELEELKDHPHWKARGLVLPDTGWALEPGGLAPAMTLSDEFEARRPPGLGEDTEKVLLDWGFEGAEAEGLLDSGAVRR